MSTQPILSQSAPSKIVCIHPFNAVKKRNGFYIVQFPKWQTFLINDRVVKFDSADCPYLQLSEEEFNNVSIHSMRDISQIEKYVNITDDTSLSVEEYNETFAKYEYESQNNSSIENTIRLRVFMETWQPVKINKLISAYECNIQVICDEGISEYDEIKALTTISLSGDLSGVFVFEPQTIQYCREIMENLKIKELPNDTNYNNTKDFQISFRNEKSLEYSTGFKTYVFMGDNEKTLRQLEHVFNGTYEECVHRRTEVYEFIYGILSNLVARCKGREIPLDVTTEIEFLDSIRKSLRHITAYEKHRVDYRMVQNRIEKRIEELEDMIDAEPNTAIDNE